jgi:cysteinyl-tRNA synthetase
MSKSLGNFFTIRDIVKSYPYNVIRFFILLGHYRMPINFSDQLLESAKTSLERISTCVNNVDFLLKNGGVKAAPAEGDEKFLASVEAAAESFVAHMDDDLNTADAITDIFNLVKVTNTAASAEDVSGEALKIAADKIRELTGVLGIELFGSEEEEIPAEITELVEARTAAKKAKDFAEADRIRDELKAKGYIVKDTPNGPQLEKI